MNKSNRVIFLIFVLVVVVVSGCATATTPIPLTSTLTTISQTNTPIPTADRMPNLTASATNVPTPLPSTEFNQVNIDGFGNPENIAVMGLVEFRSDLYASVYSYNKPAEIWKYDGINWSQAKVWDGDNLVGAIEDLVTFNGVLYAGTANINDSNPENGAEIWRSTDGEYWENVFGEEFIGLGYHAEIPRLFEYKSYLYAATWSYDITVPKAMEIWRSPNGNPGSWERVVKNGFENPENTCVIAYAIFNENLIAGTCSNAELNEQDVNLSNRDQGSGHFYTTSNGTEWHQIPDIPNEDIFIVSAIATFNGSLYTAVISQLDEFLTGKVYQCMLCDGSDWKLVLDGPYKHSPAWRKLALEEYDGFLYYTIGIVPGGAEIWRTHNGIDWERVASEGIDDSESLRTYWDNGMHVYQNKLYVALTNKETGVKIWEISHDE